MSRTNKVRGFIISLLVSFCVFPTVDLDIIRRMSWFTLCLVNFLRLRSGSIIIPITLHIYIVLFFVAIVFQRIARKVYGHLNRYPHIPDKAIKTGGRKISRFYIQYVAHVCNSVKVGVGIYKTEMTLNKESERTIFLNLQTTLYLLSDVKENVYCFTENYVVNFYNRINKSCLLGIIFYLTFTIFSCMDQLIGAVYFIKFYVLNKCSFFSEWNNQILF